MIRRQMAFEQAKRLIDEILEPQKWGFQETYQRSISADMPFKIIYNSEWCRVYFAEDAPSFQWGDANLSIGYGRLHAPNEGGMLICGGEECWAWCTEWFITIGFLEGISPSQVAKTIPNFLQSYWEKVLQSKDGNTEAVIRMERAIWEHYGTRLFKIFDLRQLGLWTSFKRYVEEYYRIAGWQEPRFVGKNPFPPPWKIC